VSKCCRKNTDGARDSSKLCLRLMLHDSNVCSRLMILGFGLRLVLRTYTRLMADCVQNLGLLVDSVGHREKGVGVEVLQKKDLTQLEPTRYEPRSFESWLMSEGSDHGLWVEGLWGYVL
jgi:hypothetical protein